MLITWGGGHLVKAGVGGEHQNGQHQQELDQHCRTLNAPYESRYTPTPSGCISVCQTSCLVVSDQRPV